MWVKVVSRREFPPSSPIRLDMNANADIQGVLEAAIHKLKLDVRLDLVMVTQETDDAGTEVEMKGNECVANLATGYERPLLLKLLQEEAGGMSFNRVASKVHYRVRYSVLNSWQYLYHGLYILTWIGNASVIYTFCEGKVKLLLYKSFSNVVQFKKYLHGVSDAASTG